MNSRFSAALLLVLVPSASSAHYEKPVTFLQEGTKHGKRVSRSGEVPQPDYEAYWRLESKDKKKKNDNWLKLSRVRQGKAYAFHYRRSPRFFKKILPYVRYLKTEDYAGLVGQFGVRRHPTIPGNLLMEGLFSVVERVEKGEVADCPEYAWWMPTNLSFSKGQVGLELSGKINSKKIEKDGSTGDCKLGRKSEIKLKLVRHKGVRFSPVFAGRYIHTLTVGAPHYFGAEVEIEWDYKAIDKALGGIGEIQIRLAKGSASPPRALTKSSKLSGKYRYVFHKKGAHKLEVIVLDKKAKKVFRDLLVVDLN